MSTSREVQDGKLVMAWKRITLNVHLADQSDVHSEQWWNITQYICSSTVLKYQCKVLVFYLSISLSCNLLLLLHYVWEGNMVLLLHYICSTALVTFQYKCNIHINAVMSATA